MRLILDSSQLIQQSGSGSTEVTADSTAAFSVLQRQLSSGRSMLISIQRYLYLLWMSARLQDQISNYFRLFLLQFESIISPSFPRLNFPQTHLIQEGEMRIPKPWNSPLSNSPTYLFPLLNSFSPQVSSCDSLQQPFSMNFKYKLLEPFVVKSQPQNEKPRPCSCASQSKQPIVYLFAWCLISTLDCVQKARLKAWSCLFPIILVALFLLKTSSLSLLLECSAFYTKAPLLNTSLQTFNQAQSIRTPAPWALKLESPKGMITMYFPCLQATSNQSLVLQSTDVIEFQRKMMLCPEGVS